MYIGPCYDIIIILYMCSTIAISIAISYFTGDPRDVKTIVQKFNLLKKPLSVINNLSRPL